MNAPTSPPALPWWRRKPTSPGGVVLYLAIMAIISGLISVLINRLLNSPAPWGHFGGGVVISLVLNGITLSLKHHREHAGPATTPAIDTPRS